MTPATTFSFLFTDIEGSTRRWEAQPDEMSRALARHDAMVREAVHASGGRVFKAVGDAFCAVFPDSAKAVRGALALQQALSGYDWGPGGPLRVRAAIHTGPAEERDDDYFGQSLNRAARLLSAGHGGQTLLSWAAAEGADGILPPGVSLRDLGERRLKDLTRPERVFQVVAPGLSSDFPPLRTLDARPNNLPAQATALIGREAELLRLRDLIRGGARLITLSGPGGTGKTRLGLQAAAELSDEFEGGVWFVPLQAVRDPALVVPVVAALLGVKESGCASLVDALKEFLRGKRLLLFLDNFEQVEAAGLDVADLISAAPGLTIIVTSRSLLHVYGEQDFPVPSLALENRRGKAACQRDASDAVRLFVERARAARPDFELTDKNAKTVAEICARLDGLPLAIELAAARARLLSPDAILAELCTACGGFLDFLSGGPRNLSERQRTLRNAIAWSYDLLTKEERSSFDCLSVFCGGFDREAAQTVLRGCAAPNLLETLLDKSLIRAFELENGAPRFELLETIREFANEKLKTDPHELARLEARHLDYYLALAEAGSARLTCSDQKSWAKRLERELPNFRKALAYALKVKDTDKSYRLAAALGPLWDRRGRYTEGKWLSDTLGLSDKGPADGCARVRYWLGQMHRGLDELPQANSQLERALDMFRAQGNLGGEVDCLTSLVWIAMYQGDLKRGEALVAQLMPLSDRLGEPRRRALALRCAAWIAQEKGDQAASLKANEEALSLMRQAQDGLGVALTLNILGECVRPTGDYARAAELYEESLALARELDYPFTITLAGINLAVSLMRLGRLERAGSLMREALEGLKALGGKRNIPPTLIAIAALACAAGRPREAGELLGAAEKMLSELGAVLVYSDRGERDETVRAVKTALGEKAYELALAQGRKLSLDTAVSQALELASTLSSPAAS